MGIFSEWNTSGDADNTACGGKVSVGDEADLVLGVGGVDEEIDGRNNYIWN